MFDNLNTSTSNPNPGQANDKPVDDIFAETEAPSISNMASNSNNIEAQPAGLAAQPYEEADDDSHGASKSKSIIIMALAALIIISLAYLAYIKFFSGPSIDDEILMPTTNNNLVTEEPNNIAPVNPNVVVEPIVDDAVVVPVTENINEDTIIDSDLISPTAPTEPTEPVVVAPVDSDSDSLTDPEEIALGTNINLIDSDFDGLSDYEEVRIYGTNPLNADTDGDGYKDGDEVKNGYNPNGLGILQ